MSDSPRSTARQYRLPVGRCTQRGLGVARRELTTFGFGKDRQGKSLQGGSLRRLAGESGRGLVTSRGHLGSCIGIRSVSSQITRHQRSSWYSSRLVQCVLNTLHRLRKPIPTWRTYVIESSDGGDSWSSPRELVPGDTSGGRGPVKNPVVVLSNGDWLACASTEVTLPKGGLWDAFADIAPRPKPGEKWKQGERWERAENVRLPPRGEGGSFAGEGVIQPAVWESAPGHVHMHMRSSNGWIQRADSVDYGRTWGPAYDSPLPSNNSGESLDWRGGHKDERPGLDTCSVMKMVTDYTGQCVARTRDGRLVAAYNPVPVNWGPRTPLVLSISEDNGIT